MATVKGPSAARRFLWFIAGANHLVLQQCPLEQAKYSTFGFTILITATLAAFSGGYALYTIFKSVALAAVFGFFWGYIVILNIDRALISTIRKTNSPVREWIVALPRLLLAFLLGVVIAKPLELKIFEPEINFELRERVSRYYGEVSEVMSGQLRELDSLRSQKILTEEQAESRYDLVRQLESEATREADGTDGTGKRGLGDVYSLKAQRALEARRDYEAFMVQKESELGRISKKVEALEAAIEAERTENIESKEDAGGLLARIEVFQEMKDSKDVIWWADLFIIFIFLVLESAPIIVKTISSRGSYDEIMDRQEKEIIYANQMAVFGYESDVETAKKIYDERNKNRISVERHKNQEILQKIKLLSGEVTDELVNEWKAEELRNAKRNALKYVENELPQPLAPKMLPPFQPGEDIEI